MVIVVVAFCAAFLLIVSMGLLLFYREALPQRIAEAINPRPKKRNVMNTIRETGFSIGGAVEHFEHLLPKSQAEISIVLQRLQRAGFRDESAVKVFYGCKVIVPIVLCVLAFVSTLASLAPFFVYACCLGLGFLARTSGWARRSLSGRRRWSAAFRMYWIFW